MTQRLEVEGGKYPEQSDLWDDGSDHDDVTKIYVRGDREGIQFIQFNYVGNGQLIDESFHGFSNHGEYLVSVEGYCNSKIIQALQFKTNLKVSEIMGYEVYGYKFTLASYGKKIIGFHGYAASNLNCLGAYVTSITPTKMEAKGGKGGKEWDDGGDYEALTKIHVRVTKKGIKNIQFDYVDKSGHPKAVFHGSSTAGGTIELFAINHADNEYLLSIDGYYDETSGVILALQFKTNMKTSDIMGGKDEDEDDDETSTKFSLGRNGNKIIGFHGYADKKLYSLGAYFTTLPITKLEYKDSTKAELYDDGNSGYLWDDGTFQGVRKVYVYYDGYYMRRVRFEYDNGGKVESREHGSRAIANVQEREFVLDYPDEVLTSVKGTSTVAFSEAYRTMITSLSFKTSKGRTSPTFGNEFCTSPVEFELEKKGYAIVGFHGRSFYNVLHALGAYFFPVPLPQ